MVQILGVSAHKRRVFALLQVLWRYNIHIKSLISNLYFKMAGFTESSLVKYVRGIKALPSEIFNWRLFITVVSFALAGCPKGMFR